MVVSRPDSGANTRQTGGGLVDLETPCSAVCLEFGSGGDYLSGIDFQSVERSRVLRMLICHLVLLALLQTVDGALQVVR